MSWRELVNWDPESYTQIEHNTQNEESKLKKAILRILRILRIANQIKKTLLPNLKQQAILRILRILRIASQTKILPFWKNTSMI